MVGTKTESTYWLIPGRGANLPAVGSIDPVDRWVICGATVPLVSLWTCPDCDRRFGKKNQSHECAPAMTIEDYFSTGPDCERPIFESVWAHLLTLEAEGDDGPIGVYVEPVSVGIFFKGRRTFAQLRPMTKWVALSFNLNRKLTSSRLSRKVVAHGNRFFHVVNIADPSQVDDQIEEWLTESFFDDIA